MTSSKNRYLFLRPCSDNSAVSGVRACQGSQALARQSGAAAEEGYEHGSRANGSHTQFQQASPDCAGHHESDVPVAGQQSSENEGHDDCN